MSATGSPTPSTASSSTPSTANPAPKLRVLVLDHTAVLGGAELALARLLEALDPTAFTVEVLLFSDGAFSERLREVGIDVDVRPLRDDLVQLSRTELLRRPDVMVVALVRLARYVGALRTDIGRRRPDLVVTNSLKSTVLGGPAALLARVPWVWHLHDRLSADYLPGPVAVVLRRVARFGPRLVVTNSRDAAAQLGRQPTGHVVVAHPGLPVTAFAPPRAQVAPPVVGMLGRISSTKGQREFLLAAAQIAATRADVRFRLIGRALFNDQPYADELTALIDRLGIGDRVELVGWTPDPTTALAELTAVVHASPVPEPFGQVVVEAMAAGVPVVATRAGGVGEILDPDETVTVVEAGTAVRTPYGQLVAPGDVAGLTAALDWLLNRPAEAAVLAGQARELAADRFRIEATAEVVTRAWRSAALARSNTL